MPGMTALHAVLVALATVLGMSVVCAETPKEVNVNAGDLDDALEAVARQFGVNVIYTSSELRGVKTEGVSGVLTPREAVQRLIKGTALRLRTDEASGAIMVSAAAPSSSAAPTHSSRMTDKAGLHLVRAENDARTGTVEVATEAAEKVQSPADQQAGDISANKGIPEILVKGSRSSNTDIRRTEDDVQPYVVFDAEEIGRSMAPDLETFLKTRLPMNQSRESEGQSISGTRGNQSSIDLRGLGADQTLILVNGRRMPGVATNTDILQPDINGIPLSAVERIEILPSTAGGIYGGGATGGVVNIILKRNYNDLELAARYDGTFAGGAAERRLDAAAGFTLEGGRTHVMITGSYRDGNPLYVGDRDFAARARALLDKNLDNHELFVAASIPVHGYTTNILSADGSDLELTDGRELGSPIAHVPVGYAGPDSDNGAAFLGTANEYNIMPANDVLGRQYALLHAPTVRSLQLNLRRTFSDHIEAFVDATRYDNRAVRIGRFSGSGLADVFLPVGPNNPFAQEVRLMVPMVGYEVGRIRTSYQSLSEQLGGGVIVRLPREWTVQGEYSLGRSSSTRREPPPPLIADGETALIDGRLDPLRDVNAWPLDFSAFYPDEEHQYYEFSAERDNATLRVSGPLLQLPGGPLRLSALLERREQFTGDRVYSNYPGDGGTPTFTYYPEVGSSTDSGYAELNAPLISATSARPGLLGLDLRASYRHDTTETTTRGNSERSVAVPSPDGPFPDLPFQTNTVTGNQYTLGFRYTPVENMALRLSYGEGILAPAPLQLSAVDVSSFLTRLLLSSARDPQRGGLPVNTTTIERYTSNAGGSLLLRPERSASWSGGVIFTPVNLPGFRLSLDYTRIEKTDEIGALSPQVLLDLEDKFPGKIVRNELTAADAALGYTGGTIREFDGGQVNITRSLVEAVDIQADYRWETRFGLFAANLIATVQPHLLRQPTPDSDETNTVGYSNGPLKWRGNAGLRWSRGAWDLGWNMQYYDASLVYTSTASNASRDADVLDQGSALIPTQTYHDVYGRYRFENMSGFAGGLLENAELQISVQNVLDTSPPIVVSTGAFIVRGYATEGNARLRRYSIAFTRRFGL